MQKTQASEVRGWNEDHDPPAEYIENILKKTRAIADRLEDAISGSPNYIKTVTILESIRELRSL
jgi:hypothetical protein